MCVCVPLVNSDKHSQHLAGLLIYKQRKILMEKYKGKHNTQFLWLHIRMKRLKPKGLLTNCF